MTTTNQPSCNERRSLRPQCFPMFCTTQEDSHKIDPEALDAINNLLAHLAWLTTENEELWKEVKELREKLRS